MALVLAGTSWLSGAAAQMVPSKSEPSPDYSHEAYVAESYVSRYVFENDGTGTQELTTRIRIQTDAGVQHWGLLSFPYAKANQDVDIEYVRVRKPDGTVVNTPAENIQDIEWQVSRVAPMYSDLREKHVAVKGLSPGDVLEYRMSSRVHTPAVPGEFWLEYSFTRDDIVLNEELLVSVPRARQVNIKNADVQPAVTEEGPRRVYAWKCNNLRRKTDDEKQKESKKEARAPSVQLSTFRSWEQVGKWYADLQRNRVDAAPEVRAKAAELTRNATDDAAKVRAIYRYVATEFRYVAIAFGVGRYQPHAAAEVLANQYGDCKDKHTLLASLLQAAGISAQPVLVNSIRNIDADVPSPAQFNHVISRITLGKEALWLDTTPELAPFGFLLYGLRDKQVLLVSDSPALVKTPAEGLVRDVEEFTFQGKLAADGTLTGKVSRKVRGDAEVLMRLAFRNVPQPQWKQLVQNISYSSGFMGTVDDINVSSPASTEQPFEFGYSYLRKDYSDWANHRITPALPGLGLPRIRQEDEKSIDPLELGPPMELAYASTMELPPGFTPEMPSNVDVSNDYAEYHAQYELKHGILTARRKLIVKQHEVPAAKRQDWKQFTKAIDDDTGRFIVLASKDEREAPKRNPAMAFLEGRDPEAVRLFFSAGEAYKRGDFEGVIEALRRVLAIDPKFPRAWSGIAGAYMVTERGSDALDAMRKEMEINPNDVFALRTIGAMMASMGERRSAIEVWRKLLKIAPDDLDAAIRLGTVLMAAERYQEVIQEVEPLAKLHPENELLLGLLGRAYLKTDETEKGVATLERAVELDPKPETMNDVAYFLAEKQQRLDEAEKWAIQAVEAEEKETREIRLPDLKLNDLRHMETLSAYWDTLGWIYFQKGDMVKAESYLKPAWELLQWGPSRASLRQTRQR